MKQKTKYIVGISIILVILITITLFFNSNNHLNKIPNNKETQKITLSFKNYNYYPNTITVKENIPVEITLDNSITGCFRTIVIKDLGVYASSNNPSQKITFTPNKKGSFIFACSMHMGTGTINVE